MTKLKKSIKSLFVKSSSKDKNSKDEIESLGSKSSYSDSASIDCSHSNLNIIEESFTVQHLVMDEKRCRGASPEQVWVERTMILNEQGVFLLKGSVIDCHWSFSLIKEFELDPNWIDWIIILRDGSKLFLKSYEALQIHLKMDQIIRKLINLISNPAIVTNNSI
ncbi:hypothetical protein DLAC_08929 [Tieghemostelium lacteum]|uniref:Uncharacterized protein n=1 Tax=Tieghemostelium lacteum TaxID=361077 RepID=A0A151Z8N8_TIELA|nr:hypothetical protein DLAC_08929 [Tieghemostelium lacteum]|eukprot:KYQ90325.1 hypothetical protein DLAC_08929 [Tieghemostelium lacteum]